MTTQPTIAPLTPANVREAWAHEAHDFTPWLAENIEGLSQAIGIPLELEGCEVSVDSFSADILARNPKDDTRVLIENQLEGSDHIHLGQIMTYLAGLDAKTVIWIATGFRDAHLSAINWLNEHTEESMAFFAIELKVVRIGDSPYAPIFDVVARPNAWERRLHAATSGNGEVSELTRKRTEFWQAYVDRVPNELDRYGKAGRKSNRWHFLDGLDLIISIYTSVEGVGIFIRGASGANPEDVSLRLKPHQETLMAALEADEFGNVNGNGYFLGQWLPGNCEDPTDRDRLIDWLAGKTTLYEASLREALE
jgi:hypothetical protein